MASQEPLLGSSVHDAAQRAADLIDVLVPRPGRRDEAGQARLPDERARLTAVLRDHGETGPIEVSDADLAGLRRAALDLRHVFAASDVTAAAERINHLLAGHAHPPRLTSHGGESGWHLHVDGDDDAPWAEWFLTSSCLALAVLLAERQAPPAGLCAVAVLRQAVRERGPGRRPPLLLAPLRHPRAGGQAPGYPGGGE